MSKADQIVALLERDPKMSLAIIAERVGCHPAYVRTAMHRAGIFRRSHDPDVIYEPMGKRSEERRRERERLAAYAEERAIAYESEAAACRLPQVRIVPEPQLSKLKAEHWRIIAKWIREIGLTP